MSRRELTLIGIIILLIGLLGGVAFASFGGDDDPVPDAAEASTTSTTTAAASTSTTSTTTTSTPSSTSTSTTTSTTSTTTSTTTAAPPLVAVVADLVAGEVMGLPHGTLIDEVEFLMYEVFDAPDSDSGWNEGCPFDGAGDNERQITWEGLWLTFYNDTGAPLFDGWRWRPTNPIPEGVYALNPQPDSWQIQLHEGVTPDMTMNEIGAAIGFPPVEHLGFSIVTEDWTWAYLSPDGDDSVPFEIVSQIRFCD